MNAGKRFEAQFKKSVSKIPDAWYYRFRDGTGSWGGGTQTRFQATNICDCEVFYRRVLFLIELKSHTGSSITYSAIRENQIKGLCEAAKNKWISAGFLIFFSDKERCFYLDAETVKWHKENSGRKSISFSWCHEIGAIEIPVKPLKTNFDFDSRFLLDKIAREMEENGGNLRKADCVQPR